jgi:hypothetical protein
MVKAEINDDESRNFMKTIKPLVTGRNSTDDIKKFNKAMKDMFKT